MLKTSARPKKQQKLHSFVARQFEIHDFKIAKNRALRHKAPLPPARGKAGMGVCKHAALIITPILPFPLAGGRNAPEP